MSIAQAQRYTGHSLWIVFVSRLAYRQFLWSYKRLQLWLTEPKQRKRKQRLLPFNR